MFSLAIIWLLEFALLAGVGSLVQLAMMRRFAFGAFASFWIGLMAVVAMLQFWNLWLPINEAAFVLCVVAGTTGLALRRRDLAGGLHRSAALLRDDATRRPFLLACAVFLLVAFCVAGRSALVTIVPGADTLGYHLNIVRWATDYPTVPGVANLHLRLGFNTSYLLYAALLEHFGGYQRSCVFMPGFLPLVMMAQWCTILFLGGKTTGRTARLFALLTSPYLLKQVMDLTPSLYYDAAQMLAWLALAMDLLIFAARRPDDTGTVTSPSICARCSYWIGLATLAFTFKLSGAVQLALVTGFALLVLLTTRPRAWKLPKSWLEVLRAGAGPSLLFFGYVARNSVLSGWLLFPVPLLKVKRPWSVPDSVVQRFYERDVRDWAKLPGEFYLKVASHDLFYWFDRWYQKFRATPEHDALWIGLVAAAAWWLRGRRNAVRQPALTSTGPGSFLMMASVVSIVVWFRSAPDVRFADGVIWTWMGAAVALACSVWLRSSRLAWLAAFAVAGYLALSMRLQIVPLRSFKWWSIERVAPIGVKRAVVPNGQVPPLEIYLPVVQEMGVGDSPLPASLHLNENLRLLEPGDFSRGFCIKKRKNTSLAAPKQ